MAEAQTGAAVERGRCFDSVPSRWAEQLFADHWADLVRSASRALGDSDRSAAEDLAADVILSLLSREFDRRNVPADSALAFAKAVIRHRAMHWLRGSSRVHALLAQHPDARPTDSWVWAAAVRKRFAVRRAVSGLPFDYRRAVVMYYFRGWSIADIASRERTTDGAIRVRLSRARVLLREELGLFEHRL